MSNFKDLIEQGVAWEQFLAVTDNIDSSMIKAVGTEGMDLFIQFQNGAWYMLELAGKEYFNTINSDSIGKFYHSTLKKNYMVYKINDDGEAILV